MDHQPTSEELEIFALAAQRAAKGEHLRAADLVSGLCCSSKSAEVRAAAHKLMKEYCDSAATVVPMTNHAAVVASEPLPEPDFVVPSASVHPLNPFFASTSAEAAMLQALQREAQQDRKPRHRRKEALSAVVDREQIAKTRVELQLRLQDASLPEERPLLKHELVSSVQSYLKSRPELPKELWRAIASLEEEILALPLSATQHDIVRLMKQFGQDVGQFVQGGEAFHAVSIQLYLQDLLSRERHIAMQEIVRFVPPVAADEEEEETEDEVGADAEEEAESED